MSNIYNTLKEDIKQHRRDGNRAGVDLVSTILGEIDNEASRKENKLVTDEVAIRVLNRFKKNLDETIKLTNDKDSRRQLEAVESYLPKQMTAEELSKAITESGQKTLKDIMQHLKANYPGLYDGKMASALAADSISA